MNNCLSLRRDTQRSKRPPAATARTTLLNYQWREQPQVLFLSRQVYFCRDKRRVLTRQAYFCRNKNMLVATKLLSRQICRDKHKFVATDKSLSRQAYFCRDKHLFSRQNRVFCRDKNYTCPRQNFCHDKHVFVATNIIFYCDIQFCRRGKHTFVATTHAMNTKVLSGHTHEHKSFVGTHTHEHKSFVGTHTHEHKSFVGTHA